MKTKLITIICLLCSAIGYSQSLEITPGPIMDPREIMKDLGFTRSQLVRNARSDNYSATLFFNTENKITYTGFGFNKDAFHFAALENYLNYSSIKTLSSESIDELVSLFAFEVINKQMYVLLGQEFKDYDAYTIYVNEVSKDMLVLGSPIKLQSFKNVKKEGLNISATRSHNKKYRLITRTHTVKPNEQTKISCTVFDENYSELWTKEITTPGIDKETKIQSIELDNTGNAYILVKDLSGKTDQLRLYSYFWKNDSFKSDLLGLMSGENYGGKLSIINGEMPIVMGLNQDGKQVSYFVDKLNTTTQQLEHLSNNAMPEEYYKTSKFKVFEPEHWAIQQIISLGNGNIVGSIEAILEDSKYHMRHTYNTFIFSFDKYGNENWSHVIQKKQSVMQGLESHLLVPADNKVLVIYNDHKNNINLSPEDSEVEGFRGKDATVIVQEIDPNGKVTKYPFFNDPEFDGYALAFNYSAKIEDGLYYSNCLSIQGMLNVTSRNLTFKVKQ